MSRKPTKGYYVRGHFVAEGSELDLELKRELKGSVELSRTDLKKESDRRQALGEALVTLRADLLAKLGLSDKLLDALAEAKRITNFEGRRRHMQFIGKLMRQLDEDTVTAAQAALDEQHKGSAEESLALHQAEQWRDRLIAEEDALTDWLAAFPNTDVQRLRTLIRQARKDAQGVKERPGEAVRHGKSYREIFRLVRATLRGNDSEDDSADETDTDHE
ncbi:ribosome biogenesis factor YjgA [Hydrogenophaga defluvii]|uniref:Dual-action ribosomal maturation protein DarP n=1 Tax=Hydrogenophaga defluvii TaxID=249410 RepID=A0ABW2SJI9_9BURK